jgi:hypothetical protein
MASSSTERLPELSLQITTFNAAHNPVDAASFAADLFPAGSPLPDLLVISLQECAPMSHGLLGGNLLSPYLKKVEEAVVIAAHTSKAAARETGNTNQEGQAGVSKRKYTRVAYHTIGMVALLIYARDARRVDEASIRKAEVGLGVGGMANKGAVGIRFRYHGDSERDSEGVTLTFVGAHLAAMEWSLARRNEDWSNIVKGLVFYNEEDPLAYGNTKPSNTRNPRDSTGEAQRLLQDQESSEEEYRGIYHPRSHLFIAGDLNYRTASISPTAADTENLFPLINSARSDPQHWSALLKHDQLTHDREAGRTLHGFVEEKINFEPSYKYEYKNKKGAGEAGEDSQALEAWKWAPHRWPSWTDRVLWLPVAPWLSAQHAAAVIKPQAYRIHALNPTSDHRAVSLSLSVPLVAIPDPTDAERERYKEDVRITRPFEIVSDWRAQRAKARTEEIITGLTGYATTTWEGRCVLVALLAGAVGAGFLLKAGFGA